MGLQIVWIKSTMASLVTLVKSPWVIGSPSGICSTFAAFYSSIESENVLNVMGKTTKKCGNFAISAAFLFKGPAKESM